jgi:hypothetical protein
VVKYFLEIKRSAQKELDALDETLFTRIDRKILALADNPRPAGCKKLKGLQRSSAHSGRRLAGAVHHRRHGEAHQHHAHCTPARRL